MLLHKMTTRKTAEVNTLQHTTRPPQLSTMLFIQSIMLAIAAVAGSAYASPSGEEMHIVRRFESRAAVAEFEDALKAREPFKFCCRCLPAPSNICVGCCGDSD